MHTEGQDEVSVVPAGHGCGEVVVDAFFQLVQYGQSVSGGKMDLGLRDGIDRARGTQRVNGHDGGPLGNALPSKYTEYRFAS